MFRTSYCLAENAIVGKGINMRKRMIDPEFFLDEELAEISAHARLLYIGSWSLSDDQAHTFPNRPDWIKAQLFPYEKVDITELITELVKLKKFIKFKKNGKDYIWVKNLSKWQRIDKPSKQKYPYFEKSRGVVGEYSGSSRAEVKLSKDKLSKVNINKDKLIGKSAKNADLVCVIVDFYKTEIEGIDAKDQKGMRHFRKKYENIATGILKLFDSDVEHTKKAIKDVVQQFKKNRLRFTFLKVYEYCDKWRRQNEQRH